MSTALYIYPRNYDIFIRNVLRLWRIEQDGGEMKEMKRHMEIIHSYY